MAPLRWKLAFFALGCCGCGSDASSPGKNPEIVVEHDAGLGGSTAYMPMTGGAGAAGAVGDAGPHAGAPGPTHDASRPVDATAPREDAATPQPIDETQLVSALTAPQVYALCEEVDRRLGLIGDIEAACRVEAWLSSMSEAGCNAVLADCSATGESGLGLEHGSPCTERTLPDCRATVAATLACADDNGEFFRSRTCAAANLSERGPTCSDELAELCPALFARE